MKLLETARDFGQGAVPRDQAREYTREVNGKKNQSKSINFQVRDALAKGCGGAASGSAGNGEKGLAAMERCGFAAAFFPDLPARGPTLRCFFFFGDQEFASKVRLGLDYACGIARVVHG